MQEATDTNTTTQADAADGETETFQFPPGWDMEMEIRGVLGLARVTMNMAEGASEDYSPQLAYLSERLFEHHKLLDAGWDRLRQDHFAELDDLRAQLAEAKKQAAPGSEATLVGLDSTRRLFIAAAEMALERARAMAPDATRGDDAAIVEAVAKMKELGERVDRLHAEQNELPSGDPARENFWPPIKELVAQMRALRIELAQMQATTMEGFRAKAWVAREFSTVEGGEHFDPSEDDAVAFSLAGDLLGLPAEKAPTKD